MYETDYTDCKHENKEYTCHICNAGLCHHCALHHLLNLYHNVTYDCTHDKKFYLCFECDRFLCANCVGNHLHFSLKDHFHNRKTNYFSCRHENKTYRCRTCLIHFCEDCKHKHVIDSNCKQHDIIRSCSHDKKEYLCKTCLIQLCIRCKDTHVENPKLGTHEIVLKCSHQSKDYYCRTCMDNFCCSCKDGHDVGSNAVLHDIVLVCKHQDKEYHCKTCDTCLCVTCKENHTVNLNATPHKIVLIVRCDHEIKAYHCRGCGKEFCISCSLKHIIAFNPSKHGLRFICNHGNKEYLCKTCEKLLCRSCNDGHIYDFNGILHDVVLVCTHRNKEFHCRTCLKSMCGSCKENHVLNSDIRSHYIVILCSHPDKTYHCMTCCEEFCVNCKEKHAVDLESKFHDVEIKWELLEEVKTKEICEKHPDINYKMWCALCDVPLCQKCSGHEEHNVLDIFSLYEIARNQHKAVIASIRSDVIPLQKRMQSALKENIEIYRAKIRNIKKQDIPIKILNLKLGIDDHTSQKSFTELGNRLLFELRNNGKKRVKRRRIEYMEAYEQTFEQSTNRPVQFLKIFKRTSFNEIINCFFTCKLNKNGLLDLLCNIHFDKKKQNVYSESLIKLMNKPVLKTFFTVAGVPGCDHISCLTPDRIWIKKNRVLVLTDTSGNTIHTLSDLPYIDLYNGIFAGHAIENTNELIYIDTEFNINRLSEDLTIKNTVLSKQVISKPLCIYSIPANGDILIGISNYIIKRVTGRSNITRYKMSGEVVETIVHDNAGHELYDEPQCISVNINGDVIVSDKGRNAVIVVKGERRHRFTYTGHPPESGLLPYGICTDTMSHILLCDGKTNTIQIINSDGSFVSFLSSKFTELCKPYTLGYDMRTHFLLVGEKDRDLVFCYKYITQKDD